MPNKPLHVVLMIQSLGVGGAENFLVTLINESDPALVRFSLIVFSNHTPLAAMINRPDVVLCTVFKRGKMSRHLVGDLVAVLKDLQPDIVHTNIFTADIWGTLAAKKLGLPTVSTEHNINYDYGWVKNMVRRWYGNRCDAYVACSGAVRKYMQKTYHIKKQIEVIPYGLDLAKFITLPKPKLEKPIRLGVIGRLVEQKGHAVLFEALNRLQEYSWELDVVGEGELQPKLEQLAVHFGIAQRVRFTGVSYTIPEVLAEQDVIVVPSLWEGLSIATREAMAAGRIVVASRTGGIPEFVEHNRTGVLVAPGDVDALMRALHDVFEHPNDFAQFGERAREYAEQHFAVETMVDRYLQLYQRLAK